MGSHMISAAFKESPLPVLMVLAGLFGFVEYLHWMVEHRMDEAIVIQVPAQPPPVPSSLDDNENGSAGFDIRPPEDGRPLMGPIHAEARRLAAVGRLPEAVKALDRSLRDEGGKDAGRLHERGLLMLRLGRPDEALKNLQAAAQRREPSATLLYNTAVARARLGDRDGAIRDYRRALGRNPVFDIAWNTLGLLLLQRQEYTAGLEALRRAVELTPGSSRFRPMVNLAAALSRQKPKEARKFLEEAIRLSPGEILPRLALARLESATPVGRDRARDLYRDAIRLAPADPAGHFGLGLLESRLGHATTAEREYRAALDLAPRYWKARYNLGLLLLDEERPREAEHQFGLLLEENADSRAWFGLGRARVEMHDDSGAEKAYREALRLAGGRYPEASFNLALLLRRTGRTEEAETAYLEAAKEKPDYGAAWINLCLLYTDENRPQEALKAAEKAITADQSNAKAWFLKGRLLSGAGKKEDALAAYLKAITLRPDYHKAMLNAAVLLARLGRSEEAIRMNRALLAIDRNNADVWFNLGLVLHRAGRDEEAMNAYEKAIQVDPEAIAAAQNLGVLYARQDRVKEARRIFADALERQPDNVPVRFNLALQLQKLGQSTAAERELRRVVQLQPDHLAPGVFWSACSWPGVPGGKHGRSERWPDRSGAPDRPERRQGARPTMDKRIVQPYIQARSEHA
ncbi:MAG: tetratricopeptide repeat protein, partial [Acidobacteriota bacterium]